jgi:hypothetical protein
VFIFIAGSTHVADAQGKALKRVVCERCKCDFGYEMQRTTQVAAFNPYFLAPGTGERVEQKAQETLRRRLEEESELVACPKCGWFQRAMVKDARRRKHRWLRGLSMWVGITSWVLMGSLSLAAMKNGLRDPLWEFVGWGTLVSLLIMPGLLVVRNWMAQGFEPNRNYRARTRLER